jgi:hypothetical protein
VNRQWGPALIAGHLPLELSTVWRVLNRFGLSRLRDLDPPTGRVIRRYEKAVAGELVHVDLKKFGRSLMVADGGLTAEATCPVRNGSDTPTCIQQSTTTPSLPTPTPRGSSPTPSNRSASTMSQPGPTNPKPTARWNGTTDPRTEWAYATTWTSDKQRGEALNDRIHQYNHYRYHTASTAHPSAASTTSGINTTRFAS